MCFTLTKHNKSMSKSLAQSVQVKMSTYPHTYPPLHPLPIQPPMPDDYGKTNHTEVLTSHSAKSVEITLDMG